jgi:hypothetical protein
MSLIFQTICDSKEKRRILAFNKPKIKHRIHEGICVKFLILNLEAFNFRYNISFIDPPLGGFGEILPSDLSGDISLGVPKIKSLQVEN